MSDNKTYYYLKLKDNFFDSDAMIFLESHPDGMLYQNILLKLYLRSLKSKGKLLFNDRIPYSAHILSKVVRHSISVVEQALIIFKQLDLIEILDSGAIYMLDIENFIGKSSTQGDRMREYREEIAQKKQADLPQSVQEPHKTITNVITNEQHSLHDRLPEIEIELELEKEIEITSDPEDVILLSTLPKKIDQKISTVFDYWKKKTGHTKAPMNDKRKQQITKAYKMGYTQQDLWDAIDGCCNTPHNMGQNAMGEKWDDLELILRNPQNVDRFIRNKDSYLRAGTSGADKTIRNLMATGCKNIHELLPD